MAAVTICSDFGAQKEGPGEGGFGFGREATNCGQQAAPKDCSKLGFPVLHYTLSRFVITFLPRSILMKVKEQSEKAGLKLSIQKMKIMASGPNTFWQIDEETV